MSPLALVHWLFNPTDGLPIADYLVEKGARSVCLVKKVTCSTRHRDKDCSEQLQISVNFQIGDHVKSFRELMVFERLLVEPISPRSENAIEHLFDSDSAEYDDEPSPASQQQSSHFDAYDRFLEDTKATIYSDRDAQSDTNVNFAGHRATRLDDTLPHRYMLDFATSRTLSIPQRHREFFDRVRKRCSAETTEIRHVHRKRPASHCPCPKPGDNVKTALAARSSAPPTSYRDPCKKRKRSLDFK